jgi:hypothetical protein
MTKSMIRLALGLASALLATLVTTAPALPFTRALGHVERYLDGSAFGVEPLLRPDYGFPVRQPMLVGPESVVERLVESLRRPE